MLWAGAAYANHPLVSEDTDVLGRGKSQVEVHGERTRDGAERESQLAVQLSRGITDSADLQLDLPYVWQDDSSGAGDAVLALKWRVFESGPLSFLVKPDLYLPTGKEAPGFGNGRLRWGANFVAGYEVGRAQLLGHFQYTDNRNDFGERRSLRHWSSALLFKATPAVKLLANYVLETAPDPEAGSRERTLVLGATYAWSDDVDVGLAMQKGLSEPAPDRGVRAGIKVRW
jgi:hypothetical protein